MWKHLESAQNEKSNQLQYSCLRRGGRQIIKHGEKEYLEQQEERRIIWERIIPNKSALNKGLPSNWIRRGFQRKVSRIRAEKAKRSCPDTVVRVVGAEVCKKVHVPCLGWCLGGEEGEQLGQEGKKEWAKGSTRGLSLGFAVGLFCIDFKTERDMNKERGRRKGEITNVRKRKQKAGARSWRYWEDRAKGTDAEADLEQERERTHHLLRPEGRRGWVRVSMRGCRPKEVHFLTVSFFIRQQVKALAARWWAAAGSGGLTKGRKFKISTKGSERGHRARHRGSSWGQSLDFTQIHEVLWDFSHQESEAGRSGSWQCWVFPARCKVRRVRNLRESLGGQKGEERRLTFPN